MTAPSRSAFTLTELMISIALALLLMVGINSVFTMSSRTVSAGQALSDANRDVQALQSVFETDIGAMATDSPALVIRSTRVGAFLNAADAAGDRDYDPSASAAAVDLAMRTVDLDEDGTEGEANEIIPPALYRDRNYRQDKLIFFQRGSFARQTGQTERSGGYVEKLVSPMTSREAYIWFGHLKKPNYGTGVFYNPGFDPGDPAGPYNASDNPENFYASDWVLGRMQILMAQPDGPDWIFDAVGDRQDYIERGVSDLNDESNAPFDVNSESTGGDIWKLQWSRYDLAGMTIERYRGILARFAANPANMHWAAALSAFRYQTDLIVKRPLTAESIARSVPALATGCTQFIVEFAGDFVAQNPATGQPTTPGPDGILDFVIGGGTVDGPRAIRWYGMPRDTGGPLSVPDGLIRASDDVVPVRHFLPAATYDFENYRDSGDNVINPPGSGDHANLSDGMPADATYCAGWGSDLLTADEPRPHFLRITMRLQDPRGRLTEGRDVQFVVAVPR